MRYSELLRSCGGVRIDVVEQTNHYAADKTVEKFFLEGDLIVPKNVYVRVIGTATKGTVGRLIDIEVHDGYGQDQISAYSGTFIFEIDGRSKPSRISSGFAVILPNHSGPTKWVREIKKHKKEEIKTPINKYKQELKKGAWAFGAGKHKTLQIGRITRWTNHNVWGAFVNDDVGLKNKDKEFQFESITETFLMPDDSHLPELTLAVLKGWKGN